MKSPCNPGWRKTLVRWCKFNFVGVIGALVQLSLLAVITYVFKWSYLIATVAAVECTILHNFMWHECFTWADRRCSSGTEWAWRLLRFNMSNGVISLLGNLVLMHFLVERLHLPVLIGNGMAIISCSAINFLLGDQVVFKRPLERSSPT